MSDTSAPISLGRRIGIGLMVFNRLFMGLFYFTAGLNKLRQGWLWSDRLHQVFAQRLTELEPGSIGAGFLTTFGLPFYVPVAYVVTLGELAAGAALLLGLCSRLGGALALFLIVMIGIGGYYDASLIPLGLMCIVIMATPSGHWAGLDRRWQSRFPTSVWFK